MNKINPLSAKLQAMLAESARTMALFTDDHRPLNMYAIFRADLEMPMGKLGAQAGHAFEMTYAKALKERPELTSQYKGSGNGTKICMWAKNMGQLERAYFDCKAANIPCFLIIDRNHKLESHFTGMPIYTALGIGPAYKEEIEHITKRYTCIK